MKKFFWLKATAVSESVIIVIVLMLLFLCYFGVCYSGSKERAIQRTALEQAFVHGVEVGEERYAEKNKRELETIRQAQESLLRRGNNREQNNSGPLRVRTVVAR